MFPHNLSICVVLLALVGGCVADDKHVFDLQLMPTLFGYQHVYKVVINCVKKYTVQEYSDKNYANKSMNIRRIQFDQIEFNLERCLDETKIIVRMHNIKNLDFPIWPKAYKTSLAIVNQNAVHRISFGNFFKLIIVPWLAAIEHNETAGKTFYRLDIHCAGSTKVAEFKTYTQYDTMVVFNSSKTKCDSYDVKVWPVHEHWLSDNTFNEPALVKEGITVENGATYQIDFPNHFNVNIFPRLAPNCGEVYFVEAKCCDGREAEKLYKTYTEQNALIVLNAPGCTKYDIFVWKCKKEWLKNAATIEELDVVIIKSVQTVEILNGDTFNFEFSSDTLTQPPSQNANNDVQKSETAASAPAQQQQEQPLPHLASSQSDGLGNREVSSKQQQQELRLISSQNVVNLQNQGQPVDSSEAAKQQIKLKQVASQSVDQQNNETAGQKLNQVPLPRGELQSKAASAQQTRQEESSKSDDDESELTETEKKKLKRMSEDIEQLKDNVKLIKKQICGIRSDLRTTVSEISQFLASIE